MPYRKDERDADERPKEGTSLEHGGGRGQVGVVGSGRGWRWW